MIIEGSETIPTESDSQYQARGNAYISETQKKTTLSDGETKEFASSPETDSTTDLFGLLEGDSDDEIESGTTSAFLCADSYGVLKCNKIGNMLLLCECSGCWNSPNAPTRCFLGPFRAMFATTVATLGVIAMLVYGAVVAPTDEPAMFAIGVVLSSLNIILLVLTAVLDPGIFPRHTRPLVSHFRLVDMANESFTTTHSKHADWTYSSMAQSFRPPTTLFW
jgi:hypothetical protein